MDALARKPEKPRSRSSGPAQSALLPRAHTSSRKRGTRTARHSPLQLKVLFGTSKALNKLLHSQGNDEECEETPTDVEEMLASYAFNRMNIWNA